MKIKVNQPVQNYKGEPVVEPGMKSPLMIRDVIITSLNASFGGEIVTSEKKNELYQISKKVQSKNEPDFTVNQLALIKDRVGLIYNPMVFGWMCDLIENNGIPPVVELEAEDQPSQDSQQESPQSQ